MPARRPWRPSASCSSHFSHVIGKRFSSCPSSGKVARRNYPPGQSLFRSSRSRSPRSASCTTASRTSPIRQHGRLSVTITSETLVTVAVRSPRRDGAAQSLLRQSLLLEQRDRKCIAEREGNSRDGGRREIVRTRLLLHPRRAEITVPRERRLRMLVSAIVRTPSASNGRAARGLRSTHRSWRSGSRHRMHPRFPDRRGRCQRDAETSPRSR